MFFGEEGERLLHVFIPCTSKLIILTIYGTGVSVIDCLVFNILSYPIIRDKYDFSFPCLSMVIN